MLVGQRTSWEVLEVPAAQAVAADKHAEGVMANSGKRACFFFNKRYYRRI